MGVKVGLILVLAGIALAQQPTDKGINFYSLEREVALGESFAAQFERDVTATTDPRLDQIGNRLAARTARFQYRFFVFDGGTPSEDTVASAALPADWRRLQIDEAIAVAGGAIFVRRQLLARNDGELAAILAHAIGHVDLRHATRIMARRELNTIGLQAAQANLPARPNLQFDMATRKLDRSFEREADFFAVQLLRKSGFDPNALVNWLLSLPVTDKPVFSPYPLPADRAAAAEKAIAALAQ
jgi:predicted Zn-dependent protease